MSDSPSPAPLPALSRGRVAVVTGAASGIGFAAARRFAAMGMKVVVADREGAALQNAAAEVAAVSIAGTDAVHAVACDVTRPLDVIAMADEVFSRFGAVSALMNNAGMGANPGRPWENLAAWKALVDVNFWGVVHGVGAFTERMLAGGEEGLIINTGSKQGITTPPGNLAYNVTKSAVKTYTEGLAHTLRNVEGGKISAHLLIPGFTYTGLTEGATEKPAAAWSADEVVTFMLESLGRGDFYILCPDNETPRGLDEKRMRWAIGDIVENRPALSRWHPDHGEAFARFLES